MQRWTVCLFALLLVACSAGGGSGAPAGGVGSATLRLTAVKDAAADIPPGAVSVTLPKISGALPWRDPGLLGSMPTSPYLKTGSAAYHLLISPDAAAQWYEQAMVAAGYQVSGRSTASGGGAAHTPFIDFQSAQNPNLRVEIRFGGDRFGLAEVVVVATLIAPPPRPAATLLPPTIVRVSIHYQPPDRQPERLQVIDDANRIARLVSTANALPMDTRGVHGCTAGRGEGATLLFLARDNRETLVTVDPACASVVIAGKALFDQQLQLWQAVREAVGVSQ